MPLKKTEYSSTSTEDTTHNNPTRLNQAVAQPQNLPPRLELQWYKPPAVGNEEAICPIPQATLIASAPPTSHMITAPPNPAALKAAGKAEIPPARIQMIENEIAKFE